MGGSMNDGPSSLGGRRVASDSSRRKAFVND